MATEEFNSTWKDKDIKSLTADFINHTYYNYYKNYKQDSERYEKINNRLFATVTIIGFSITILLGLKEILKPEIEEATITVINVLAFILPSISSVILLLMTQKGYKRKEEIREEARIECKYLVNEARMRFSTVKDNPEELKKLYQWINEQTKRLQLDQAKTFFLVHNIRDTTTINKTENDEGQ